MHFDDLVGTFLSATMFAERASSKKFRLNHLFYRFSRNFSCSRYILDSSHRQPPAPAPEPRAAHKDYPHRTHTAPRRTPVPAAGRQPVPEARTVHTFGPRRPQKLSAPPQGLRPISLSIEASSASSYILFT